MLILKVRFSLGMPSMLINSSKSRLNVVICVSSNCCVIYMLYKELRMIERLYWLILCNYANYMLIEKSLENVYNVVGKRDRMKEDILTTCKLDWIRR